MFKNNNGTIKNLEIIIASDGMTGTGAIANNNSGTISDCTAKGNITGMDNYQLSGICGKAGSSNIEKSVVLGNIIGEYYTGGICGYSGLNSEGNITISNCYFIGEISSTTEYKAGISGYAYGYKYES